MLDRTVNVHPMGDGRTTQQNAEHAVACHSRLLSRRGILKRAGMGLGMLALADLVTTDTACAAPTDAYPTASWTGS